MNKFKKAAIEVLKKSDEPLHYREITKRAIEESLLKTSGVTPEATMSTQITVDIKNKKETSDFIRVERGVYALNINSKQEEISEDLEEKNKEKKTAVMEVKGKTKNGKGRRRAG